MERESATTHLMLPPADFSFEGDRRNQSLGINNPLAVRIMTPLFNLGLVHALITRRRNYRSGGRTIEDRHRFTLLLEGQMTIEIDGTRHEITPGNLVYSPPGATVFQSNRGNSWYLYLTFNDHPSWAPLQKRGAYVRDYESADLLYLLMERIADAYESRRAIAMQVARHEAEMLADLLKHEVALMAPKSRRHEATLQLLLEQIKEQPEAEWTIASMAETAHVSVRTLNRLFVKEFGLTPMNLVVRERMARAYDMISETDMKIAVVGQAVGYQSVASFCRLFKRQIGKSPGQCRKDLH